MNSAYNFIDHIDFDELMKNVTLKRIPQLPEQKVKVGKVTYTLPDLYYVDRKTIECFSMILGAVIDHPDHKNVIVDVNYASEENRKLLCNFLLALHFERNEKRIRWETSNFLVTGCETFTDEESGHLCHRYNVIQSHAKYLAEYASNHDAPFDIYDVMMYVADRSSDEMQNLKLEGSHEQTE